MTSDVCDKNVMVQQTLVWFGTNPEKQNAFCDLAETVDTAAVPIIATKQLIMQVFLLQEIELRDL